MKPIELENRLIDFAFAVVQATDSFPHSPAGKHLANQLVRSCTAPALLYGEAQSAESTADFVHKMRVALKELRETHIGLKLINKFQFLPEKEINPLLSEANELVSIFVASVKTVQSNQKLRR